MKATGKSYVNPPQTCSVRFNDEGKVCEYTIGYVMNRLMRVPNLHYDVHDPPEPPKPQNN
eukprot:3653263-Amphidinium_carterae.1